MKSMLISGSSRGLGLLLARHYCNAGWQVFGLSRSEPEFKHERYLHKKADLTKAEEIDEYFTWLRKKTTGLYALLNNAGISSMNHFLTTPVKTAANISQVNYMAAYQLMQGATRLMMPTRSGRVVNFSSVANPLNLPGEAAYAASKAALESLSRVSAKELAPFGITVNCVGPTPMDTDLIKGVPDAKMEELLALQPISRKAEIGDLINVIDFFLSEDSSMISAQTIYLGGVS